ncbi:MAG: LLM class flavin-dependent oxidoreductase [Acidimicrobiales bacterium]
MQRRRAIGFTPSHTDLAEIRSVVTLAEDLGYELVCLPEGWGLDSTTVIADLAARTERIGFAATILSVWGRTPATLAMTAATLQGLSGGRFILGLGASTPTLAEGFHDTPYRQPTERLRLVTEAVRTLLDGGRAPIGTDTTQRALRLGFPPPSPVPIWHGTVGPRSCEVTAELADGWAPVWMSRSGITATAAQLAATRASARPDAAPLVICCGPMVVVDDDLDRARATAGTTIAWYLCSMGPLHPRFIASQGYGPQVRAVQEANPRIAPSTGVIPAEAAALVDDFTAAGPADTVTAQLAPWDDVADVVLIGMPPPGSPWEIVEATLRAGAP